jgi:3-phosphoshikimate 1-carboxyvinyltransferase
MTIEMLEAFGARIERVGDDVIAVPPQRLRAATVEIEGDHSSVSYALSATAILGGRLRVAHLRRNSTQADARFLRDLAALGCSVRDDRDRAVVIEAGGSVPPFDWNLADAPDLAPTAAILGLFAQGPCRLTGLAHLRLKESDRLEALRSNLSRMGARVAVDGETLSIDSPGRKSLHGASIDVAADHRIAMAFAIAGLAVPGVTIDDPDSVAKSYPAFWQDLDALTRTGSSTRG